MMLCVDIGNTRVKWAVGGLNDDHWVETGVCAHEDLNALKSVVNRLEPGCLVWASNVAGRVIAANLMDTLDGTGAQLVFAQSAARCAGVTSAYSVPQSLGVDRWCAVIAGWQRVKAPTLVVSLGTASTIDAVDASGQFLGGMILPGLTLMRDSLAQRTAQLPKVDVDDLSGAFRWPTSTENAIAQGALESTAGAIARAWANLADQTGLRPHCLLTGGGAPYLESRFDFPVQVLPTLVLDGLRQMARAEQSP